MPTVSPASGARSGLVDGTVDEANDRPSTAGAAVAELIGTFMLLFFGTGAILAAGGAVARR